MRRHRANWLYWNIAVNIEEHSVEEPRVSNGNIRLAVAV